MNDRELDEILNLWQAPPVPPSLRAGLRQKFPVKRPRRLWRWIGGLALAAGVAALAASFVLDGMIGSEGGPWDAQTFMRRTCMVHPLIEKNSWIHSARRTTGLRLPDGQVGGSVYLLKEPNHEHHGYTWGAQADGQGRFLFTVRQLDPSAVREPGPIVPQANLPAPRSVGPGSAFDVDLYVSGNERVYEHFELFSKPVDAAIPRATAEEAAKSLTLTHPKLYLDGKLLPGNGGVARVESSILNVDVPGVGRFQFALDAGLDARMEKAGAVKDNTIEFQSGGRRVRIESSAPIATGAERSIYVFGRPDTTVRNVGFGAGGGIR